MNPWTVTLYTLMGTAVILAILTLALPENPTRIFTHVQSDNRP